MLVDLTSEDIETLFTSLEYSKQRISEFRDTPYEVRRANLARVASAAEKLRTASAQEGFGSLR